MTKPAEQQSTATDGCVFELESTPVLDVRFMQKRKKGKYREVIPPQVEGPVADTHAHLEMLTNPPASLARCAYHGVRFVCCMVDPAEDAHTAYDSVDAWRADATTLLKKAGLAEYVADIPHIRLAVGVHPHNAKVYDAAMEQTLLTCLADNRTCGLGEVGLDYHYDFSPRTVQREVFAKQIRIAHTVGVPLILHLREAHSDAFAILAEEGFPEAGVLLHCFNLDEEVLAPWVEQGCYIAYGGPLTFKKADYVRKSAHIVPRSHLVTETDSPYMTPEPLRGVECGPEFTIFTAARMAEVLGCETQAQREALFNQLYANALGLLDRAPTAWQQGQQGVPQGSQNAYDDHEVCADQPCSHSSVRG